MQQMYQQWIFKNLYNQAREKAGKAEEKLLHKQEEEIDTMKNFAEKINATLTVMKGGEHWFHTDEEMKFLDEWINEKKAAH